MTGLLGGFSTLGTVAVCSLSLHAGYDLLTRIVSVDAFLDAFR